MTTSEYLYTLHKFKEVENCEADSLPDLEVQGWCGKDTLYYITGNHYNVALCKDHREILRKRGLLK
jgi:hypothetical protein